MQGCGVHCDIVLDSLLKDTFRRRHSGFFFHNEDELIAATPKWPVWGNEMKWRVVVELIGGDGTVSTYEIGNGGSNTAGCSAATVGLTLADGKRILAALQHDLVRGQAEEYCRQRRVCSHCRSQRPLKDIRTRQLASLFGMVEVRAPRFLPCRCAVTHRHTLNPVAEIMPDRCTPE